MKDEQLLEELEKVATRFDITVRYEDGDFKGGLCRLKNESIIIINKKFLVEQKIAFLARELSTLELDKVYILPKIREHIFEYTSEKID